MSEDISYAKKEYTEIDKQLNSQSLSRNVIDKIMIPKEDYYREKSEFYETDIYLKSVNSFNREEVSDVFCEFFRIYEDLKDNINSRNLEDRLFVEYIRTESVKSAIELLDNIQYCINVQQVIIIIYYSLNIIFMIYLYLHINKQNVDNME